MASTTQEQSTLLPIDPSATDGDWVLEGVVAHPAAAPGSTEVGGGARTESKGALLLTEVKLGREHAAVAAGDMQAVLSVVAPPVDGSERAPLHLVAVLDKSGSMHGEKLRLVAKTMRFVLNHLSHRDYLGLVAYDTQVTVLAPLTQCDSPGRARLEAAIGKLRAGSQTNLSGGLLKGLYLHREGPMAFEHVCAGFGNTYRRLPVEEAQERALAQAGGGPLPAAPADAQRVHEWTMEFRFARTEDAAVVQKVVYTLHETFRERVVEAREAPFQLTRVGWGTFVVAAEVHLADGRTVPLSHKLCFEQSESFYQVILAQRPVALEPPASPASIDHGIVRSSFLFTDGLANVGIQTPEDLCASARAALAELGAVDRLCKISTFGFGSDHNGDLLQGLAEVGGGIYCHVENEDQIGEAFGEALGGLLSVTHQNIQLSLELREGVGLRRAYTKYDVRGPVAASGGGGGGSVWTVDLGDIFAEEQRDILVTLSLPEAATPQRAEVLGQLRAQAFSVLARRSEVAGPVELAVGRSSDAAAAGAPLHPAVQRHWNRHVATEAFEDARAMGQRRDLAGARRRLEEASRELSDSALAKEGGKLTQQLLNDLRECLGDLQQPDTYDAKGGKKMASMQHMHGTQRACGGGRAETEYGTSATIMMKALAKASIS